MGGRHPLSAIICHWTVAAMVAFLAVTGATMTRLAPGTEDQFALYQFHKAVGIATMLISVARLAWRPIAPPSPQAAGATGLHHVARMVHVALFALTLAVPLAGWALVSISRLDIPIDLVAGLAWPRIPGLADLPSASKTAWEPVMTRAHATLAYGLVGLAALHAGAAIFHHIVRGDAVLRRMLPFTVVLATAPAALDASARDWTVDHARSSLGFAGTETGNPFRGRFARWSARIAFDPARLQDARIEVDVDIVSATTDDARRDAAMLGEEWLDATGFPRAVFVAMGFHPIADGRYEAAGTLALRDLSRPVLLRFTLAETPDGTRARGAATLVRSAFGIGRGRWSGLQIVGSEVEVVFDLLARASP